MQNSNCNSFCQLILGGARVETGCCRAVLKSYSFSKEVFHNAVDGFVSGYTEHCPFTGVDPEEMEWWTMPKTLNYKSTKKPRELDVVGIFNDVYAVVIASLLHSN
ncbi:hypothetical protein D3C77_661130 [compost metagenome]